MVLDVDSGIVVPSFLGKPMRLAVESAEQSGLEINAIGSGWRASSREPPPAAVMRIRHKRSRALCATERKRLACAERSYNAGRMNFLQLLDGANVWRSRVILPSPAWITTAGG